MHQITYVIIIMDSEKFINSFKMSKNQLQKTNGKIEALIKEKTEKEFEELQKAYEKYNQKLSQIYRTKEFIQLEKERKKSYETLSKHVKKATQVFDTRKKEIMSENCSTQEKQKRVNNLYDHIVAKLFTVDEIKKFKQLRNNLCEDATQSCLTLTSTSINKNINYT